MEKLSITYTNHLNKVAPHACIDRTYHSVTQCIIEVAKCYSYLLQYCFMHKCLGNICLNTFSVAISSISLGIDGRLAQKGTSNSTRLYLTYMYIIYVSSTIPRKNVSFLSLHDGSLSI